MFYLIFTIFYFVLCYENFILVNAQLSGRRLTIDNIGTGTGQFSSGFDNQQQSQQQQTWQKSSTGIGSNLPGLVIQQPTQVAGNQWIQPSGATSWAGTTVLDGRQPQQFPTTSFTGSGFPCSVLANGNVLSGNSAGPNSCTTNLGVFTQQTAPPSGSSASMASFPPWLLQMMQTGAQLQCMHQMLGSGSVRGCNQLIRNCIVHTTSIGMPPSLMGMFGDQSNSGQQFGMMGSPSAFSSLFNGLGGMGQPSQPQAQQHFTSNAALNFPVTGSTDQQQQQQGR